MLNYDIKFFTNEELINIKNGDLKSFRYETKKKSDQIIFDNGKRSYCERRGGYWRIPCPRQLRQLESKLRDRSVVHCEWNHDSLITLVFSSGAIAYITIKPETLDVTQVLFDRYCVGKLTGQTVTEVFISKSHLLFTYTDRIATLISFGKNISTSMPCRISERDPHVQNTELGGSSRRSERKISSILDNNSMKVLIWSTSSAEPVPWSPIIENLANLHLYDITGQQITLIAYHLLENETLLAELSEKCVIHIVEQQVCHKNGVILTWLRYNVTSLDRVMKLSSFDTANVTVTLPAPARVVKRIDMRLLLACIDGSLHLIHKEAGLTCSTKAGFIFTDVRWAGDMVIASEENGRLQCFDKALSLLHHHAKCLDLSSYFSEPRRFQIQSTRPVKGGVILLVSFNGGPLALLKISHPQVLNAWIRTGRISNAVSLLHALDWDESGPECLRAMTEIVNGAMKGGPHPESMAEAAIGAYMAPVAPHAQAAKKYAQPVYRLARKFFHHLLRRGRIEKALSLAVDLEAWDLFVDARWAAERLKLKHLADEAAGLASYYSQIEPQDSECSESCSQCSSHTYTDSDDETSASSEPVQSKPPPLPRLPIPSHPAQSNILQTPESNIFHDHTTLMPVPITHQEPTSTNSIRPNLHQYLERDTTIWNTDMKEKDSERLKPQLKWTDNILNTTNMRCLKSNMRLNKTYSVLDLVQRRDEILKSSNQFRNIFQTELREEPNNTIYRYSNNNNNFKSTNVYDRINNEERPTNKTLEKNKVKFSDTVTVAVVAKEPPIVPETERELADSLPLSPPHKYLAAFEPHPNSSQAHSMQPGHSGTAGHSSGTTLDYVEV